MLVELNTEAYPHMDREGACGLIPYWVAEYTGEDTLKEHLDNCYQFGLYEMGGTVTEDGTYQYPEDPDMPWLAKMSTKEGTLYQYLYGIVAIPTEDGYFVTRMD